MSIQPEKPDVVTTHTYFGLNPAIISFGLTLYQDSRITLQSLYFPHQHEWFIIPVALKEAGSKICHPVHSSLGHYFGAKDISILYVILFAALKLIDRIYRELTSFVIVQHTSENEAAIKSWPTHPGNVGVFINMGNEGAVPNDAVIIRMSHSNELIRKSNKSYYFKKYTIF